MEIRKKEKMSFKKVTTDVYETTTTIKKTRRLIRKFHKIRNNFDKDVEKLLTPKEKINWKKTTKRERFKYYKKALLFNIKKNYQKSFVNKVLSKNKTNIAKKMSKKAIEETIKSGVTTGISTAETVATAGTAAAAGAAPATGGTSLIVTAAKNAAKIGAKLFAKDSFSNDDGKLYNDITSTDESNSVNSGFSIGTSVIKKNAFLAAPIGVILGFFLAIILFISIIITVITAPFSLLGRENPVAIAQLSEATKDYEDLVHEYAEENDLEEIDENYILVIMDMESHGKGKNPMNIGSTNDPEKSIENGVKCYSINLSLAHAKGVDNYTLIEAYNLGIGFIDYVADHGGKWTEELKNNYINEHKGSLRRKYQTNYIAKFKKYFSYSEKDYMQDGQFKAIYAEASKYLGHPYVWGGNSPRSGFDCSGLTQWCYSQAGYNLPRTAQGQYDVTTHVSLEAATPGDLVFFTKTYDTNRFITHVEIYLGDGKSLGALSQGIGIHDLNGKWFKKHFVCFGKLKKKQ